MNQRKYALELLEEVGLLGVKPSNTHKEVNENLTSVA